MTIAQLQHWASARTQLGITLPDGTQVPAHFHLTEIGEVTRRSIDCGGVAREERYAVAQLWVDQDTDHRLSGTKMAGIIAAAAEQLNLAELPVVVEYQTGQTINLYNLEADANQLRLTPRETTCLAMDACGVPGAKQLVSLAGYVKSSATCSPGGGCC